MHKLILLFAAASVTFTGCLKNDNSSSKFEPVRAGIAIYDAAASTNHMALQTADIGIRMGMLLAEAKQQEKMNNLNEIQVEKFGNAVLVLFGTEPRTKIVKTAEGYDLIYSDSKGVKDDYIRKGTYRIRNNGVEQLSETTAETPWQIVFLPNEAGQDTYLQYYQNALPIYYDGGYTTIYSKGNNSYQIEISGIVCYLQKEFRSNWSGGFSWKPRGVDLTISANVGKTSQYSGSGRGESFYSFNNVTAASMSYTMESGVMIGYRRLGSGTEICRLNSTSDYDPLQIPSPEVKVTWSNDGNSYTIQYNGQSVSE